MNSLLRTSRRVTDTGIQPVGMFAVMRHTAKLKAARFVCLHETRQAAVDEANRLAADTITVHGFSQFCFYVVEISARAGCFNDRLHEAA